MEKRLSPSEMELYRRIDEVLHYIWDPIGVSGVPEARDEYHSYLPKVFNMLTITTDGKDIVDFLISVERDTMGLAITDVGKKRTLNIVDILLDNRDWIKANSKQQL